MVTSNISKRKVINTAIFLSQITQNSWTVQNVTHLQYLSHIYLSMMIHTEKVLIEIDICIQQDDA